MSKKRYTFRPRAKLVSTLGDELISSDTVALIELVKNAFDADAEHVLIRFRGPLKQRSGGVDILDDGHGMSEKTIETAWLEPATGFKRGLNRSESKSRRLLGEKGVGRFAAQRLGHVLELVTRRAETKSETSVSIDWDLFENDAAFLSDVEVNIVSAPASVITRDGALGDLWKAFGSKRRTEAGTLLSIEALRHDWTRAQFEDLRRGLARLVSPFFDKSAFRIKIQLPKPLEDLSTSIESPETLERPRYKLTGSLSQTGTLALELTVELPKSVSRAISQQLWLPASDSKLPRAAVVDPKETSGLRRPECGPVKFEIRMWDREERDLQPLAEAFHTKVRDLRRDLDDAAGVNIYRDGFRVLPYGEPGNDWLNLDARRVQNPTLNLSNNQLVGYIQIGSDSNPLLRDQTNRQGLIENQAFHDLREVLLAALTWTETQRYDIRTPSRLKRKTKGGLYDRAELRDLREHVAKEYKGDKKLVALVERVESRAQELDHETQEAIARYRRLANLGGLVDKVIHDCVTPLGYMRNEAQLGELDVRPRLADLNGFAELVLGRFVNIDEGGAQLGEVFKRLRPFGGRAPGKPREMSLEAVIEDAFRLYQVEIDEMGVLVELPKSQFDFRIEPGELKLVISNLLDNALYWLKRVPREERAIKVVVGKSGPKGIRVDFSDSGPGVDSAVRDRIFDPYFSTKPNGVGLGLAIAGEIIEDYYNGRLELLDKGPLPGATFRAVLNPRI